MSAGNTAKKCLCGAPVARWRDCPLACKAGLCEKCFRIYYDAGVLAQVINTKS